LINEKGEKGLKRIKKLNGKSYRIVKRHVEKGAELQATENMDLVRESMDWIRCLTANLQSEKALSKVSQFYVEAMQKRDEFVAKRINETLKENESGIIFIRENNSIEFPSDIEIFRVHPPVLDDIRRYLRDFYSKS
jgi:U3 small nucleolar RNA-associated protein 14